MGFKLTKENAFLLYIQEEENKIELNEFILLSLPQRSNRVRTENCFLDGVTNYLCILNISPLWALQKDVY